MGIPVLYVCVMSMLGPRVDAAVNVKCFINCSVAFVFTKKKLGGFHAFRLGHKVGSENFQNFTIFFFRYVSSFG